MTTYKVVTQGRIDGTFRSEKSAIKNCGPESVVVMVVKSGTYESRTVIHPAVGTTFSK
jgi:hypothetical protein